MNKTGRYARVGTPQRDGDVSVVRALDPVTGLPVRVYRFEADPASGAAAFRHPNAVRVLEAGRDDDGGYVVAEVIDGAADLIARPGALDVASAAAAAAALAAAHGAGLIHGDPTARRVLRRGTDVWLEGLGVPWRTCDPNDDVRRFASSLLDVPGLALPPPAVEALRAAAADETATAVSLALSLDRLLGPVLRDEADEEAREEVPDGPQLETDHPARDEPHQDPEPAPPADEPDDEPDEADDGEHDGEHDEPDDDLVAERADAGHAGSALSGAHDEDGAVDVVADDEPGDEPGDEPEVEMASEPVDTEDTDDTDAAVAARTAGAAGLDALDPPDAAAPAVVRRRVATHDVVPEPTPPPGLTVTRRTDGPARSSTPLPRPEPPRPQTPRSVAPPQGPQPGATPPPTPAGTTGGTPGGFSKTPPPDVTYRVGASPLAERQAGGGRTAPSTPGVRQRRRTWMLAALLLGALILAIVTAVARRPVPPPTPAFGTVTSIVVDVRIEPATLPPASLVVVASPASSRLRAGSALGTVPRRVVFDAEGTWQVEARFGDRRSDIVTFRLPDERDVVLRFPSLP